MALFDDMVQNMQRMGFFQYLFPFLLAFAIMYGVLGWVFKGEKLGGPRVHALISIILSFFVMLYSASNPWLSTSIAALSGIWLSIATFIIFVVVLMALAGINVHEILGAESGWKRWIIVLIVLYVILSLLLGGFGGFGFGTWGACLPFISCSELWTVVFFLVIIGIVFWWIGGEGKGEKKAEAAPPAK